MDSDLGLNEAGNLLGDLCNCKLVKFDQQPVTPHSPEHHILVDDIRFNFLAVYVHGLADVNRCYQGDDNKPCS